MTKTDVKKILVIDDDDMTNFLTNQVFNEFGKNYELTFQTGVEEAISFLENDSTTNPDIILLDINLGVYTGWDFMEEYLKRGWEKKLKSEIYVLSTSIYESDKQKAQSFGDIKGYIEKPISKQFIRKITF